MTMLDHYVRAGDMRRSGASRAASSYVSDFDAWPEKTPAAAPAQPDRAGRSIAGGSSKDLNRPAAPGIDRERSFA